MSSVAEEVVERYALEMVLSGAESVIEDDLNEEGDLTPEQHTRACEFGYALLQAIRDHRAALIRSAREVHEPGTAPYSSDEVQPRVERIDPKVAAAFVAAVVDAPYRPGLDARFDPGDEDETNTGSNPSAPEGGAA